MGFQKIHQDDTSAVLTGSFNQKTKTSTNSLGLNGNVVVSQTTRVDAGNTLMSTVPQTISSREDEGLFSYYPSQGSKLNYLFNNNNASSDAAGQFQAPDSFNYLKDQ